MIGLAVGSRRDRLGADREPALLVRCCGCHGASCRARGARPTKPAFRSGSPRTRKPPSRLRGAATRCSVRPTRCRPLAAARCWRTSRRSFARPTSAGSISRKHLRTAHRRSARGSKPGNLLRVRRAAVVCPGAACVGDSNRQPREQPCRRLRRRRTGVDARSTAVGARRLGRQARRDHLPPRERRSGRLPRLRALQVGRTARPDPRCGEARAPGRGRR